MDLKEYISSGILEQYVLGTAGKEESLEVERLASANAEVRKEIDEISRALELHAMANADTPSPTIKPFLMATIDYMERMKKGEPVSATPVLTEKSKLIDYASWLNRDDMILPAHAEDIYAKIIDYSPEKVTAIVWLKDVAPREVHHDEHEKFLIVEGTCNFILDEEIYQLVPGDYFSIPLHKSHSIKVTSGIPCKVILQRVAA